jgi:hypothetical protein
LRKLTVVAASADAADPTARANVDQPNMIDLLQTRVRIGKVNMNESEAEKRREEKSRVGQASAISAQFGRIA